MPRFGKAGPQAEVVAAAGWKLFQSASDSLPCSQLSLSATEFIVAPVSGDKSIARFFGGAQAQGSAAGSSPALSSAHTPAESAPRHSGAASSVALKGPQLKRESVRGSIEHSFARAPALGPGTRPVASHSPSSGPAATDGAQPIQGWEAGQREPIMGGIAFPAAQAAFGGDSSTAAETAPNGGSAEAPIDLSGIDLAEQSRILQEIAASRRGKAGPAPHAGLRGAKRRGTGRAAAVAKRTNRDPTQTSLSRFMGS